MPFTFVAFFLEDKKRCPFTPKTFVPQKWVFGHVFFRGEDFILQRVFCEGKTQTKQ